MRSSAPARLQKKSHRTQTFFTAGKRALGKSRGRREAFAVNQNHSDFIRSPCETLRDYCKPSKGCSECLPRQKSVLTNTMGVSYRGRRLWTQVSPDPAPNESRRRPSSRTAARLIHGTNEGRIWRQWGRYGGRGRANERPKSGPLHKQSGSKQHIHSGLETAEATPPRRDHGRV